MIASYDKVYFVNALLSIGALAFCPANDLSPLVPEPGGGAVRDPGAVVGANLQLEPADHVQALHPVQVGQGDHGSGAETFRSFVP